MKKYLCIFVAMLFLFAFPLSISAENEHPWEDTYANILSKLSFRGETTAVLLDFDYDNAPELVTGDENNISVYTYKNASVIKLCDEKRIPVSYFKNLKTAQDKKTNLTSFLGQVLIDENCFTYKMTFKDSVPAVDVLAMERPDGSGTFKGANAKAEMVQDCTERVKTFLDGYTLKPFTLCSLTAEDVSLSSSKQRAISDLFARYRFLVSLPDDTKNIAKDLRDTFKKLVGNKAFLSFDKISRLSANDVFVQYYADQESFCSLPYEKQFAVISDVLNTPTLSLSFENERELDTNKLVRLKTAENAASNIYIDYTKTLSFRGIDDYVTYLANVLSDVKGAVNENGKKELARYLEFAVNKSSRTEIKAKNNTVTVNDYSASFISENATLCMDRLTTLCEANGVTQIRPARTIPEIICKNTEASQPIRIEYEPLLSASLGSASGIRLMLSGVCGIYITKEDLETLQGASELFCIEIKKTDDGFSIVFTDQKNNVLERVVAPVWFILPAESEYSTVIASFRGGSANWGGQFDPEYKTLEFSTVYSGDYEIAENDITVNDIDALSENTQNAIRFLVSKGIFSVNAKNRFKPDATLSRYDFTAALVKMFYATDIDAATTFLDVAKSNEFYRYIASAEAIGIAEGFTDRTFRGRRPVSREQVFTLCGRTLVEKKGYTYPEMNAETLLFDDTASISEWAKPDIAVSVRHGLLENAGAFSPASDVTRAEGAEVLYKTFMLLYDVSPVTTKTVDTEAEIVPEPRPVDFEFRAAILIVASVLFLFIGYIGTKLYKKRKKK